ncbi:hypothetical protein [Sphingomonas montanisoli]|uniref:Uncharacterized protein n=1 Tax=Sphingomonas montanisoli TaxID=2606412 RepID=A0A5D9CBL2_9SPHN|nr:hypothetical protein [Sphingomonas montanisoli]TZG27455.1 hypothetical protein FYJ91_07640 [Sphingomonas montanisoli]
MAARVTVVPLPQLRGAALTTMTRCRKCGAATNPEDLTCRYCGHRVNDQWRAEIRERRRKRRRLMLVIPSISIVLIAILLFAAWPRGDAGTGDGSISASNSYISQVVTANGALYANVDLPTSPAPDDAIVQAGIVARDAGRAIKGGSSEVAGDTKWIVFQVTQQVTDTKGNRTRANVFLMKIDIARLKMADYKVTDGRAVLDMAESVRRVRPISDKAFQIYCRGKGSDANAQRFCALADQASNDPLLMPQQAAE